MLISETNQSLVKDLSLHKCYYYVTNTLSHSIMVITTFYRCVSFGRNMCSFTVTINTRTIYKNSPQLFVHLSKHKPFLFLSIKVLGNCEFDHPSKIVYLVLPLYINTFTLLNFLHIFTKGSTTHSDYKLLNL